MDKSYLKVILFGLAGFIVLIVGGYYLIGCNIFQTAPTPTVSKITIWGVNDEPEAYTNAIAEFKKIHKNVKDIEYVKLPCKENECLDYIREVTQGLASGNGPDIFMVNNTWIPSQKDKMLTLDAVNAELEKSKQNKVPLNIRTFGDTFVPVAKKDFVFKDNDGLEKIYAVPLYNDNLAVFYNRDFFNLVGLTPPPKNWTWQQFNSYSASFESYASKMAKIDSTGNILRAGAAIGYGSNVNRSPDILATLMMQMGSPIVNNDFEAVFDSRIASSDGNYFSPGEYALSFFTKFSDRNQSAYTWNPSQWQSIDAFTAGKVGMMIHYSYQIKNIQDKAPNLNMGIAYLPRIKEDITKPMNLASYWGLAVSRKDVIDQKAIECWNFLEFLTEQPQADVYAQKTGRVSARLDLINKQKDDPWLGVFADQALYSTSYLQADNARNDKILEDAINSIVDRRVTPAEAASNASQQMSQEGSVLNQKLKGNLGL